MNLKIGTLRTRLVTILAVVFLSLGPTCFAEDEQAASNATTPAQSKDSTADLRGATQNPIGAMYSLPIKFTSDFGATNGSAQFLNIHSRLFP